MQALVDEQQTGYAFLPDSAEVIAEEIQFEYARTLQEAVVAIEQTSVDAFDALPQLTPEALAAAVQARSRLDRAVKEAIGRKLGRVPD